MLTRRSFLHCTSLALPATAFASFNSLQNGTGRQQKENPETLAERHPAYAPDRIERLVTVSHFSLDQVKEVVDNHPQLVKAAWDWGFGDWETPLGAACHMGRRDIAEYLLSKGATASIFSAVLFGDLALVTQSVERRPGIQRIAGPHSISLLAHARMGGKNAEGVFAYLDSLGDADMSSPMRLTEEERKMICGSYQVDHDTAHMVEVSDDMSGYANSPMYTYAPQLNWKHTRTMARPLFHQGAMSFYPAGAPSVQIQFVQGVQAVKMTVKDGEEVLTASHSIVA